MTKYINKFVLYGIRSFNTRGPFNAPPRRSIPQKTWGIINYPVCIGLGFGLGLVCSSLIISRDLLRTGNNYNY